MNTKQIQGIGRESFIISSNWPCSLLGLGFMAGPLFNIVIALSLVIVLWGQGKKSWTELLLVVKLKLKLKSKLFFIGNI